MKFPKVLMVALAGLALGGCVSRADKSFDESLTRQYAAAAPVTTPRDGGIATSNIDLFADVRAHRVGDILIVALEEQTQAQKSSSTSITKSTNSSVTNPTLAGNPVTINKKNNLNFELDSSHDFSGGSDSNQSNSLSGTVAVTVTQILPGGNLLVQGEKWLTINRGKEFIRLRGVVRPTDVSIQNVVSSNLIANAEIIYSGTGETAQANTAGWLARFFMGAIWPF